VCSCSVLLNFIGEMGTVVWVWREVSVLKSSFISVIMCEKLLLMGVVGMFFWTFLLIVFIFFTVSHY
jgi:hypothetical protein